VAEVIVFNHIEKTAGSTLRHVFYRALGTPYVLSSFTPRRHRQRIAEIARQLDRPLQRTHAVMTHSGFGVHDRLPPQHDYSMVTFLRDPVERTVSRYHYGHDLTRRGVRGGLPAETSLEEYLSENVLHAYNHQTAFLGGLWAKHHLEGLELTRVHFDRNLLEEAKRNLAAHDVIGLTAHFDTTLLLLRRRYRWPAWRILYRPTNVGRNRRAAKPLSDRQLDAVRASNELDAELYEYAKELFEARLLEALPDHEEQLRRHLRLNRLYGSAYPYLYPPAKALVGAARRIRTRPKIR
jgi:hypothetical protein